MRFLFIDAIDEFVADEYLKGRLCLPRTLAYPAGRPDREGPAPSLLLEALAQAGGWLIKASRDFRVLGIMSVVRGFRFHQPVPRSGALQMHVRFTRGTDRLLVVTGTLSLAGDKLIASVDAILYVLVPAEGAAYTWGVRGWEILTGKRDLSIIEDRR